MIGSQWSNLLTNRTIICTKSHFFSSANENGTVKQNNQSDFKAFLRTFARKFSNIDFFLKILTLKDDELVMSEM